MGDWSIEKMFVWYLAFNASFGIMSVVNRNWAMGKQSTLMSTEPPTKIQQLRSLAATPAAQAAYAATLLHAKLGQEVIGAALQVLQKIPFTQARPALVDLYTYYTKQGDARDPSAFTRAAIIRALRQIVLPVDRPLLIQATETYVFPPPSFKEEGAPLRSAALLALNEVDDQLARYSKVSL